MRSLIENGIIRETGFGEDFAYTLNDGRLFQQNKYEAAKKYEHTLFLPFKKIICNGRIMLYYITEDVTPLVPLPDLFFNLSYGQALSYLYNLFTKIEEINRYDNSLSLGNVDLRLSRIYAERRARGVRLCFVPVETGIRNVREYDLKIHLAHLVGLHPGFIRSEPYVRRSLMMDLNDASVTLGQIRNFIRSGEYGEPVGLAVPRSTDTDNKDPKPKTAPALVRTGSGGPEREKTRLVFLDPYGLYLDSTRSRQIVSYFSDSFELVFVTERDAFERMLQYRIVADMLVMPSRMKARLRDRSGIKKLLLIPDNPEFVRRVSPQSLLSGIKDLFNGEKTEAMCPNLLSLGPAAGAPLNLNMSQRPQMILFCAADGGMGKTTVSMGFCATLASAGRRVLYINASSYQTFDCMLQNSGTINSSAVYATLASEKGNLYTILKPLLRQETFTYLPPFGGPIASFGLPFSVYARIAAAARFSGDFDVVCVDTDAGLGNDLVQLVNAADKTVVVVRWNKAEIHKTNLFLQAFRNLTQRSYVIVANDYRPLREHVVPQFPFNCILGEADTWYDSSVESSMTIKGISEAAKYLHDLPLAGK